MVSNELRSEIIQLLRERYSRGATPSQLVALLGEMLGKPFREIEFDAVRLMMEAFDLRLSEARAVLESPLFGLEPLREEADCDRRFARILSGSIPR